MANKLQPIVQFQGRVAVVTGYAVQMRRVVKYGGYQVAQLRYVDGHAPKTALVPKGKLEATGRVLTGPQAAVWRRVDELVQEGMDSARALRHAMAEQDQHVLAGKAE